MFYKIKNKTIIFCTLKIAKQKPAKRLFNEKKIFAHTNIAFLKNTRTKLRTKKCEKIKKLKDKKKKRRKEKKRKGKMKKKKEKKRRKK